MTIPEDNLDQTTQPANVVNQPSLGNNAIKTTLNMSENNLGQMKQLEIVANQLPLNLPGQITDNLQSENQPSSSNYDGKFITIY